jgi:hypothetical protein
MEMNLQEMKRYTHHTHPSQPQKHLLANPLPMLLSPVLRPWTYAINLQILAVSPSSYTHHDPTSPLAPETAPRSRANHAISRLVHHHVATIAMSRDGQ